jgi:hypothetical protein
MGGYIRLDGTEVVGGGREGPMIGYGDQCL